MTSDQSKATARDRARGALLGLAVGDALGTTLEFSARDSKPHIEDISGGGPFNLEPGQWTDDTAMALALGQSLIYCEGFDERNVMNRFVNWFEYGEYSCTGTCFDIGITTRQALTRYRSTGDPVSGSTDPQNAGNGSLMRLSPVPILYWRDRNRLVECARRQSALTHGAAEAVDACAAYSELIADAIAGTPKDEVLRSRPSDYEPNIAEILNGGWRGKTRNQISSSGYVVHSLEAALWCVASATNFKSAVVVAGNLGDDADTVAAITGQLAGALWGASSFPADWLERLAWRKRIDEMAGTLFDLSATVA